LSREPTIPGAAELAAAWQALDAREQVAIIDNRYDALALVTTLVRALVAAHQAMAHLRTG
jgi:hypothetical protein